MNKREKWVALMTRDYYDEHIGELVELYSEVMDNEESFSLGYIIENNKDYLIFLALNEYGMVESYQLRFHEYITGIETDSGYIDLYERLIEVNDENNSFDPYDLQSKYEAEFEGLDLNDILYLDTDHLYTFVLEDEEEVVTGYIAELHQEGDIEIDAVDWNNLTEQRMIDFDREEIVLLEFLSNENYLLGEVFE